jgi:uncharacterized membrane protein YjgN (DUF898 family)
MTTTMAAAAAPAVKGSALPIRFTASGSEYFRIWIVNLLLTLLTVGLYHPWAKVRKLRYFYGNTWVGEHPFDFHGEPRRMLRGSLLVGALFAVYSLAGRFSATAGVVALLLVAAVMPALLQASLRFRLANTSWRGMRFHFTGSVSGAYRALVPGLLPAVVFVGLSLLAPEAGDRADAQQAADPRAAGLGIAIGLAALTAAVTAPYLLWRLKHYQHGHYALGQVQSQLRAGPKSFYGLCFKTSGVALLTLAGVAVVGVGAALLFGFGGGLFGRDARGFGASTMVLLFMAGYAALVVTSHSFLVSRLQNLVWNRTKSSEIRFESRLRLRPLVGLTLKNWLLMLLTLGLYWPFAAVATARLKLEAMTVYTRHPVDDLSGRAGAGGRDATGDAAGDVFGLDLGF